MIQPMIAYASLHTDGIILYSGNTKVADCLMASYDPQNKVGKIVFRTDVNVAGMNDLSIKVFGTSNTGTKTLIIKDISFKQDQLVKEAYIYFDFNRVTDWL